MQRTVPILYIGSYDEAKAHYVDWLGFQIEWEFRLEPTCRNRDEGPHAGT
jgi:hypothetical protein